MSFLGKLFSGRSKKQPKGGPMPTRRLNFQFEVTPENGFKFAQQFVDAVKHIDKKELNYSVETIEFVDNFLQRFSDEGLTVNDIAETIFVAGCYVGQIMVEKNDGSWVAEKEIEMAENITMMPIVIKLSNGNIVDPIAKAFKRFYFGDIENIKYFYEIFTRDKT